MPNFLRLEGQRLQTSLGTPGWPQLGQGATRWAGRFVIELTFNSRKSEVILVRKQLTNLLLTGWAGCGQGFWGLFHLPSHCSGHSAMLCLYVLLIRKEKYMPALPLSLMGWRPLALSKERFHIDEMNWNCFFSAYKTFKKRADETNCSGIGERYLAVFLCTWVFSSEKWGEIIFVFFAPGLTTMDSLELGIQQM